MKKLFISAAFVLVSFAAITAQPRAIGLRLGNNFEASYQHSISDKGFLQADAGFSNFFTGTQLVLTYNHILLQPDWTDRGEWNFSVGGGIGGGYNWSKLYLLNLGSYSGSVHNHYGYFGLVPVAQLSYTFWFPLQLSVDYRPILGLGVRTTDNYYYRTGSSRTAFYLSGLYDFAVSARYTF